MKIRAILYNSKMTDQIKMWFYFNNRAKQVALGFLLAFKEKDHYLC